MTAEATGGGTFSDSIDSLIKDVAAAPSRVLPPSGAFTSSFVNGARVGRYVLSQKLGHGGMGAVWEAVHAVSGKRVALKIVRDGLPVTDDMRRRFAREAKLVTTVGHPGVVEVHDLFEAEDGCPVLVMELLHGETLAAVLRRERLPLARTAQLLAEVVAIVRAAHAAGVVHRDLKPENIFLCNDAMRGPTVRVLDFGIARLVEPSPDPGNDTITQAGTIIGTLQYMAPEQLFGDPVVDDRADVWALGVILYECITGSRPVEGNNVARVVRHLSRDGVPELRAGSCPDAIRAAVGAMLTVERADRVQRLDAVEVMLRECAAGKLRSRRARPRSMLVGIVAALALAAAGVRHLVASGSAPAAAPVLAGVKASAPTGAPQITIATEAPRSSASGRLVEAWRRAVAARTGGHIAINVRWPGMTGYRGGERTLVTRLRTLQIDGAMVGARALRLAFPSVAAIELPGIVDSWTKVDWVREHLREPLRGAFAGDGYQLLAFQDEGCERIVTRGHAVRRPADLTKLRVAALENDPVAPLFASVVPSIVSMGLGLSDVAEAFLAGPRLGVSAVVGTAADAERFQWTKAVDAVTQMPVLCASGALVLRTSAYERLAADERAAFDETAVHLEEQSGPRLRKEDTVASLRLLRTLSIVEPSVADRREWQRAFRRAAAQADGSLPRALVEQVLALSRDIDALQ